MTVWPKIKLSEVLHRSDTTVDPSPQVEYREITVRLWGKGVIERGRILGAELSGRRFLAKAGQFIASRIDSRNGAMGLVPQSLDGALVTNDFPLFDVDTSRLHPTFLDLLSKTPAFVELCQRASEGTTNRVRLKEDRFYSLEIPLPPLPEQQRIVSRIEELAAQINEARTLRRQAAEEASLLESRFLAELFDSLRCQTKALGEIAAKKTGTAYRAQDFGDCGVPVVRLKEIGTKKPEVFLGNPEDYSNVWLEEGDIILAKTSFSTGAMCQWSGPRAVLNQNAVSLRALQGVDQKFLFAWLKQQVQRYLSEHLADPDFYPYIRESDLVRWRVPVPSECEQHRVVVALDTIKAELETVHRLQSETTAELDALLPALLDRAFKGEL